MDIKWLKFLVDPHGKNSLKFIPKKINNSRIIEGKLLNKRNSAAYSIIRGIPRFISRKQQTSVSFGNKWLSKPYENMGKSKPEIKVLKEQYLAMLGVKNKHELKKLFKDGMNCLNAGCGVAWSEYLFNVNKNVNRFAVDFSFSVEAAYRNTKNIHNVFVAQADIFNLPFQKKFFDIIFSDGVLHHTGNARRSFNVLCSHLKKNGLIGIYIYNIKPFMRELADQNIRKKTITMNFKECLTFSKHIALLGKSLQNIKQKLVITQNIPLLGIKKGIYNLQKFIYDHFIKCYFNQSLDLNLSTLTNVDWYHPANASHHTKDEIFAWFKENKIGSITCIQPKGWEHSGYFVSGRKKQ